MNHNNVDSEIRRMWKVVYRARCIPSADQRDEVVKKHLSKKYGKNPQLFVDMLVIVQDAIKASDTNGIIQWKEKARARLEEKGLHDSTETYSESTRQEQHSSATTPMRNEEQKRNVKEGVNTATTTSTPSDNKSKSLGKRKLDVLDDVTARLLIRVACSDDPAMAVEVERTMREGQQRLMDILNLTREGRFTKAIGMMVDCWSQSDCETILKHGIAVFSEQQKNFFQGSMTFAKHLAIMTELQLHNRTVNINPDCYAKHVIK